RRKHGFESRRARQSLSFRISILPLSAQAADGERNGRGDRPCGGARRPAVAAPFAAPSQPKTGRKRKGPRRVRIEGHEAGSAGGLASDILEMRKSTWGSRHAKIFCAALTSHYPRQACNS